MQKMQIPGVAGQEGYLVEKYAPLSAMVTPGE